MKITNLLPHWLNCITEWHARPSASQLATEYEGPLHPHLRAMLDDFIGFRGHAFSGAVEDMDDWSAYRSQGILSYNVQK